MNINKNTTQKREDAKTQLKSLCASAPLPLCVNLFLFLLSTIALLLLSQTVNATLSPCPPGLAGVSLSPCLPISYGTYVGDAAWEQGNAIAVDNAGNAYVTGYTQSITFPLSLKNPQHGIDVIALKLNPAGSNLNYAIWFNATTLNAEDYGYGLDVDNQGNVYIVGLTNSDDFCQFLGDFSGYDTTYNGSGDAFVLKIKADGSTLDYCTYLGGSNDLDIARAIAVDDEGNAYITGGTWSTGFVTTPGAFDTDHNGLRDVFVTKLNPTGTAVLYSTFLGGGLQDEATALALDPTGNVYLTGWTTSTDFYTTTTAYDTEHNGGTWDTFVAKVNPTGSDIAYSTFIGGNDEDKGTGIAVDPTGRAYLTGYTRSPNFPATTGAFDTSYGGGTCSATPCYDAFVARLTAGGNSLEYAAYLGDNGEDIGRAITLDANNNAYLTGETSSATFPTTADALDDSLGGKTDAFIVKVNNSGSQLLYASFLGGSSSDQANALTLGPAGLYLTGHTFSADFPTTPTAYDTSHNGDYDVFITAYTLPPDPEPTHQLYLPAVIKD